MKAIFLLALAFLPCAVFCKGLACDVPAAASCEEKTTGILFRSSDGGTTWEDVSEGIPKGLFIRAAFAMDETFFIGTGDGYFYHCNKLGSGEWLQQGIAGTINYESITGIFSGASGTYVSIYGVGLFRKSSDGGWKYMSNTLEGPDVHDVMETEKGIIIVSGPKGIYKSSDDGQTWSHVYADGWAGDLAMDDDILVANAPSGLIRSTDNGETWKKNLNDEGSLYTLEVIEGHFVAIRTGGPWKKDENEPQHIYTSADGGASWQNREKIAPARAIHQLEQVGTVLFNAGSEGISRSADGGKTWQVIHPAPANFFLRWELVISGEHIFAIAKSNGC